MPHKASFWKVGLLDVVLSEYPDKSQNFPNLTFYDVTLQYSIPVASNICLDLLQVDLLASGASLFGREAADRERRSRDRSTCLT